jgi:hypothetical protein
MMAAFGNNDGSGRCQPFFMLWGIMMTAQRAKTKRQESWLLPSLRTLF